MYVAGCIYVYVCIHVGICMLDVCYRLLLQGKCIIRQHEIKSNDAVSQWDKQNLCSCCGFVIAFYFVRNISHMSGNKL